MYPNDPRTMHAPSDLAVTQERSQFVKQAYIHLFVSMLSAGAGAFLAMAFPGVFIRMMWPIFFVELLLIFALRGMRYSPVAGLLLNVFTFMTGLTLGLLMLSTLSRYGMGTGGSILLQSFLVTAGITLVMSAYARRPGVDLSGWGKPLMIGLIGVLILMVVNIFLGSSLLDIVLSAAMVLLFTFMIAYNTQMMLRGAYETPVQAALSLYLDIFNLLMALIRVFSATRD